MTLALSWGSTPEEQGLIYLDATTLYTQNHSGQVTRHPVDGGFSITDAFIRDNPKFTVNAVITGVDISQNTYLLQDLNGNFPFNTNPAPTAVSVNSTDNSLLRRFIPGSVGQFLPNLSPDIQMQNARIDLLEQVRQLLINLMSGTKFNEKTQQFDSNVEIVAIYEYENTFIKRILNNLVMTNITFDERPETGEALYCNMTFEQVTFVTLKKTEIPRTVSGVSKKAASKKTLSKADSTVKDGENPPTGEIAPNEDALRPAVANNG